MSTPCCSSDSWRTRPRASTSARLMVCGARAVQERRSAAASTRPSPSTGPAASAGDRRAPAVAAWRAARRRRRRSRRPRRRASAAAAVGCASDRRGVGVALGRSSRSSLLSDERSRRACRAARPSGRATVPTPAPGARGHRAQRGLGDEQRAADDDADQHDDRRPPSASSASSGSPTSGAEQAAGVVELVEVGEALGPADDVQQPERGEGDERPADDQAQRAGRAALVDERDRRRRRARAGRRTARTRRASRAACAAPRPSGPARSKNVARASSRPPTMRPMPTNSCSRPADALAQLGGRRSRVTPGGTPVAPDAGAGSRAGRDGAALSAWCAASTAPRSSRARTGRAGHGVITVPRGYRRPLGIAAARGSSPDQPGSTARTSPSASTVMSSVPPSADRTTAPYWTAPPGPPTTENTAMSESGRSSVTWSRTVAGSNATASAANVAPSAGRERCRRAELTVEVHVRDGGRRVVDGDEHVDQLRCGVDLEVALRPTARPRRRPAPARPCRPADWRQRRRATTRRRGRRSDARHASSDAHAAIGPRLEARQSPIVDARDDDVDVASGVGLRLHHPHDGGDGAHAPSHHLGGVGLTPPSRLGRSSAGGGCAR